MLSGCATSALITKRFRWSNSNRSSGPKLPAKANERLDLNRLAYLGSCSIYKITNKQRTDFYCLADLTSHQFLSFMVRDEWTCIMLKVICYSGQAAS